MASRHLTLEEFEADIEGAVPLDQIARDFPDEGELIFKRSLARLRERQGLTQAEAAARFPTTQPEISKIENRGDLHISTLIRYIEALDGRLELIAHFDDGDMRITQFDDIDYADLEESPPPPRPARPARKRRAGKK
jgi:transcriptional regulator with XRE-family HTH domain